jgi:glycosidase
VQGRYEYQGWSGYDSLPVFQELGPNDVGDPVVYHESELNNEDWANYMLYDENSVARRWFKKGISGWRLDVATEVDSEFWKEFRSEIKKITLSSGETPVILGETWQDASHFFLGDQFDSVMNYGFRYAVQDVFLINGAAAGADAVFQSLHQNYPKEAVYALMNLIDSHDTSRAIYLLGGGKDQQVIAEKGKNFDYEMGKRRLKLALIFQMGYPGVPTIYYGDEVGLFGARDPDCRRTYPWSKEDQELFEHYRKVATIRTTSKQLFAHGDIFTLYAEGDVYVYGRKTEDQYAVVAINRGEKTQKLAINTQSKIVDDVMLIDQLEPSYTVIPSGNTFQLTIPPMTGRILLSSRSS